MDQEKIQRGVRLLLEGIGEDPERDGLVDTPRRVADMFEEIIVTEPKDLSSLIVAMPPRIRSWALPFQTSVPCERPDMRTSSAMVFGRVSRSIPRTKLVPNSGMPNVPTGVPMSCSRTLSADRPAKMLSVALSFSGTAVTSVPRYSVSSP